MSEGQGSDIDIEELQDANVVVLEEIINDDDKQESFLDVQQEEEPTTPVPTFEITATTTAIKNKKSFTRRSADSEAVNIAKDQVLLSKETRKLRKKKVFESDDESPPKPVTKTAVISKTSTATTMMSNKKQPPSSSSSTTADDKKSIEEEEQEETTITTNDTSMFTLDEVQQDNTSKVLPPPEDKEEYLHGLLDSECLDFITDQQIDHVDTDDLMEELDRSPQLRKTLTNNNNKKKKKRTSTSNTTTAAKKLAIVKTDIIQKYFATKKQIKPFDPQEIKQLAQDYPDTYWRFDASTSPHMITSINANHRLTPLPFNICDQGAITGMTISTDGTLLITFCNMGTIKIWDIRNNFTCLRHIRDKHEAQIDEFYCGQLIGEMLVTGGKLKNRHRWSSEDNDNHILPCPIKIFDVVNGERVAKLEGHSEEILCIKAVLFKEKHYLISTSQDGYIIKWHMDKDWITLLDSTPMMDGVTCMAFTVSFVPNTGNKYFLAACDEHLRLYDFEQATLLQTFEDMYSSYCDCGKFVNWVDQPPLASRLSDIEKQVDALAMTDNKDMDDVIQMDHDDDKESTTTYAWFISRGAEMCDVSDGVSSKPNSCTLHKLVYPDKVGGKFELQTIKKYTHEGYHANSWLVKITSNGRYILAPTIYGQIFVFNMATEQVTAVIKEHTDIEVRDVIFHPYMPLIFSCSDDGFVKVYTYMYDDEEVLY